MAKFKVGDKVCVRKNIKAWEDGENYFVHPRMLEYRGKIAHVEAASKGSNDYALDIDDQENVWEEQWLEPVTGENRQEITIAVDLSDLKSAYKTACKAIKNAHEKVCNPEDWTEEEINHAVLLCKECLWDLNEEKLYADFYRSGQKITKCVIRKANGTSLFVDRVQARLAGDVYNEIIGKCVCLCKATGRKIPKFILKKNT